MKTRLAVLALAVVLAAAALAAPAAAHNAFPAMSKACVTYDLEKGYWVGTISGGVRGDLPDDRARLRLPFGDRVHGELRGQRT
jgi:hypothetical protein